MESYVTGMRNARRLMAREDLDTRISVAAYAVRLLRRSVLAKAEKRAVLSACGANYTIAATKEALIRLHKEVSYTDKHTARPVRLKEKYHKKPTGKKGRGCRGYGGKGNYGSNITDDDESETAEEDAYEQDSGDSVDDEAYLQGEEAYLNESSEDEDMYEAMAQFLMAK